MHVQTLIWLISCVSVTTGQNDSGNCDSAPCQNEALCEDTEAGFRCFCVDGYAGTFCEVNFDDCNSASVPCLNNGTCIDQVANYTCLCMAGFTGKDCQFNINECLSNPCLRNGTCIDLVNGFVCECVPPFRGDNCSSFPCDTSPCENEAVCRNDVGFNESLSGFVCDCITGFTGPRCEINIEDCDLDNFTSCSGNGLCIDGINDYSCLCEPGWVGEYCGSPVDDCFGNSCKNNATCTDLHLGYLCTCQPGYEGSLCEREKDECSEWQPCKNGATCIDLFNDYRCECTSGWFGVNCTDEVNECETNECQNGAQCLDIVDGYRCRCPPFYTGLLCETLYNPCAPEYNPCQNGANCIVPPDGIYRCFCPKGFTGVHCEVNVNECLSLPCANNATCEDITAGYLCHCPQGWTGQNCQDNIDDCVSEPCLNGADCLDLHNGFECNCTREYQGPTCDEAVDFCLKDPCYHDSTCISFVGGYGCLCSPPYTGDQCLDLIDSCQSYPCSNNGTCMNTVSGFICSCPSPYTGDTCDERVDFCASEPCFLGTCVSLDYDFVCACPEFITGKQCTDLVDYCAESPCENEGNCINGEFDFRCVCAYGFTGRTCIEMVDFCGVENPCQNNASCTNVPGGYTCHCLNGFTGDLCQSILPSSTSMLEFSSSTIYDTFPPSTVTSVLFPSMSDLSFTASTSSSVNGQSTSSSRLFIETPLFTTTVFEYKTSVSSLTVSSSDLSTRIGDNLKSTSSYASVITTYYSRVTESSSFEIPASFSTTKYFTTPESDHTVSTKWNSTSTTVTANSVSLQTTFTTGSLATVLFTIKPIVSTSLSKSVSYSSFYTNTFPFSSDSTSTLRSMSYSIFDLSTDLSSSQSWRAISSTPSTKRLTVISNVHRVTSTMSSDILHKTMITSKPASLISYSSMSQDSSKITASELQTRSSTSPEVSAATLSYSLDTQSTADFSTTSLASYVQFSSSSVPSQIELSITFKSTVQMSLTDASRLQPSVSYSSDSFRSISLFPSSVISLANTGTMVSTKTETSSLVLMPSERSNSFLTVAKPSTIETSSFSHKSLDLSSFEYLVTTDLFQTSSYAQSVDPSSVKYKTSDVTSSVYRQSDEVVSTLHYSSDFINIEFVSSTNKFSTSFLISAADTISISSSSFSFLLPSVSSSLSMLPRISDVSRMTSLAQPSTSSVIGSGILTVTTNLFQISTSHPKISIKTPHLDSSTVSSRTSYVYLDHSLSSIWSDLSRSKVDHISVTSSYDKTSTRELVKSIIMSSIEKPSEPFLTSADTETSPTLSAHTSAFALYTTTIQSTQPYFTTTLPNVNSKELETSHSIVSTSNSIVYTYARTSIVDMISPTKTVLTVPTSTVASVRTTSSLIRDTTASTQVLTSNLKPSQTLMSSYSTMKTSTVSLFSTTNYVTDAIFTKQGLSLASVLKLSTTFPLTSSIPATESTSIATSTEELFPTVVGTTQTSFLPERTDMISEEVMSSHSVPTSSMQYLSITPTVMTSVTRSSSYWTGSVSSSVMIATTVLTSTDHQRLTSSIPTTSVVASGSSTYQQTTSTSSDLISLLPTLTTPSSFTTPSTTYSSISSIYPTSKEGPVPLTATLFQSFRLSTHTVHFSSIRSTSIFASISPTESSLSTSANIQPITSVVITTVPSPSTKFTPISEVVSTTTTIPTTTCDIIVCYNGGVCKEDVSGTFCVCREAYIGDRCETESTACDGYLCENGGQCVVTLTIYSVQVPRCNCPLPFVGTRCENEMLIYYPAFGGSSYLKFQAPDFVSDQSNEIYISVKTTQPRGTILYSANENAAYKDAAFITLYLTNGKLRYTFSCDGVIKGNVHTDVTVNTGDVYDVIIRQVWSVRAGDWCSAAVLVNSRAYVSAPVLSVRDSHPLGNLYIGGVPRFIQREATNHLIHIMDGFIGCVHSIQVNQQEIDMMSAASEGVNIDNCNVPVCQHNPCLNGATCHSSGEEWYCSCLPGYGGALCDRKLCGINPCKHGGTCIVLEKEKDQLCLCPYGRAGAFCEQTLSTTLHHFVGDQYGYSSYIAYDPLPYLKHDLEVEFAMVLDNDSCDSCMLLFIGNTGSYDGRADFLVVGIERDYVVLRFDLGSGYGQVYSAEKLDPALSQHRVRLGRERSLGWIQVDNQRNVTGRSPGILTALNTNSKLYIGNIELSQVGTVPSAAVFKDGFRGCIFNLRVKNHFSEFTTPGRPPGHVVSGRNVGHCSAMSCDRNPCQNGAECRDLGASIYCVCEDGWKGTFCTDTITICDRAHACLGGSTCVPRIPSGYKCLCPLGRKGTYCEEEFEISDPMFIDEDSFMAFEPVFIKKKIDLKLQLKSNSSEGLLFYVAQHLHSHAGDFLSLTLNEGRVELRIDMGTGVNIISHPLELESDNWYTINAGRNTTHCYVAIDNDFKSALLTGQMILLDTTTDFYIGALPNMADVSPDAFDNEPATFHGCIRELIVNDRVYRLNLQGTKDGRNIGDCDGTSCGYSVCSNGGTCLIQLNNTFSCVCTGAFAGPFCDVPLVCIDHQCQHGTCSSTSDDSYVCDCFIGWSGTYCEIETFLNRSMTLSSRSFLHLLDDDYTQSNKSNTYISFSFRTTSLSALIMWNGQTYSQDEDYLGVGIQDGRLKVVWNLGWYSRSDVITSTKVNDGEWHHITINRESQQLLLNVDEFLYESRVSGDFYTLDTRGEYYIGSFGEGEVREKTLEYFTGSFDGCMKNLQVYNDIFVDLDGAVDGRNVLPCPGD